MKMLVTVFACLMGSLPLISEAANNTNYQCQQVCGYTAGGPLLSFLGESEFEAKQTVIDTCANMGRTLQGNMTCRMIDYGGTNSETYEECRHGTVNGGMHVCRTAGVAYILENGKKTTSVDFPWNISRCSFAQSEQYFHAECDRLAKSFPNTEIRCVIKYQDGGFSPSSSPPPCP